MKTQCPQVELSRSTPEGEKKYQQERICREMASLLNRILDQRKLTSYDLGKRMNVNGTRVREILEGANIQLKTLADTFTALGLEVVFEVRDIVKRKPWEPSGPKQRL